MEQNQDVDGQQVSGILVREFPLSADTILPNVAIADTGKLVRAVVEDKATYFEKTIAFWAEGLSEGEKLARLGSGTFCRRRSSSFGVASRELTRTLLELGIPVEYRKSTPEQFQKGLEEAGLTAEISLDFTEQLLMFEYFGNVYASHDFVQAREVSVYLAVPA